MRDVDLDTIIYSMLGGLTASGNTYLALKAVMDWQILGDISGLHWMELLFAFLTGALVTFKAKRSKSPKKDPEITEKIEAYENTIEQLRKRRQND